MSGFFKSNPRKKLLLSLVVFSLIFRLTLVSPVLAGGGDVSGGMDQTVNGEGFLIEKVTDDEEATTEEGGWLTTLAEERRSRWLAFGLVALAGFGVGIYTFYRRFRV